MILTIEFLGPFGAADTTQRDAPEWPPHPDRVFQALVDAADLGSPDEVDALRWLESQRPPDLAYPDAVQIASAQVFVPVNYPDSPPDLSQRSHQPRFFPTVWPRGRVQIIWPEPSQKVVDSLRAIAGRVSHVGRAESHVVMEAELGSVRPTIASSKDGTISLRVPHAGRLDELESAYRRGSYPNAAQPAAYREVDAMVHSGPWRDMVPVRLRHPLSLTNVVAATDALRRAVMSRLGDTAPAVAHGHVDDDHIAWVGLPNLSQYAKGELLGLAMVLPTKISGRDRALAVQALVSIDHVMVAGKRRVEIEAPTHALSLAASTWSRPARRWVSVSPVVLDRFPRRGLGKSEIVARGIERAGFPRPASVALTTDPADGFAPPAQAFRLRKPGRLYSHAVIEFDVLVRGPVIAGAERYFGLGMFRPADVARTTSNANT